KRRVAIDAGDPFHERPRQLVIDIARPIGERRDRPRELTVAIGLGELAIGPALLARTLLGRAMTQHQMRKIDVELMRRHVRALRHEAHVAERAGFDDLAVILGIDLVELAARGLVDHVEEAREAVAKIEAAATAVTDIEDAL